MKMAVHILDRVMGKLRQLCKEDIRINDTVKISYTLEVVVNESMFSRNPHINFTTNHEK